ncbi:hypothetical protein [Deinococcus sp.]|uniref:hypothetical protein n=1 Tax=Deinococcus sp. TaxID=47478 RepID=UPI003CC59F66
MNRLHTLLAPLWLVSRPLVVVGLGALALLLACSLGLMLDHRTITGMPAWDKPFKFAVSSTLYCLTLVWMLGLVQGRAIRLARLAANLTALGFVVELVVIVVQVLRGTTSHFNLGTPLDAALYSSMGGFVLVIWLMNLLTAVLLAFQPLQNRALALSVRLALALTLLGGSVGALMTLPTAAQTQGLGKAAPTVIGAHTVGAPDGGPGLPFLGWSTVHGDLRVAHFAGLHALQVMPLVYLLLRRRRAWTRGQRLGLIWTAAGAYLGLIGLLLWQALRGQSVVAPDGPTLLALGLLLLLSGLSAALVGRRRVRALVTG